MSDFDRLPEDERLRLARDADVLLALLLKQHGVRQDEVPELLEAVRWVREHRAFLSKIQTGGMLTAMSLLVTALGAAVWEGIRSLLRGAQ